MKKLMMFACLAAGAAFADGNNFVQQQAYAEMQRVAGQIDVLQNNFNDLQERFARLEGNGAEKGLRQEIDSLKAGIADLRREMKSQRDEIVKELAARIAKLQPPAPAAVPKPAKPAYSGPVAVYVVEAGDTLSTIAQACGSTVAKLKEINGLKSDALRVGQKLNVPK